MLDNITRIHQLVKDLNRYRHAYYNLNKPLISDLAYDRLYDELLAIEKETGIILSNSPTQTVGYQVISKLQKVTHKTPLKSLDKTKSVDELNSWGKKKEQLLMLKADGLTIELDYENGILIESSTRGDGEIGEITTHNAKVFKDIPVSIPFKGLLRLAGEAVIHKKDFEEINSKLPEEDKYATPRNLVSGSVRQLDSKNCAERNVHFYAFNILECDEQLTDSKYDNFQWLNKQGFTIIPHIKLLDGGITEKLIDTMKLQADKYDIPIDGLVTTFDSVSYSNTLPVTSHHPLHSLAFKFYDETFETILRSVEWRTTRTGMINPTGIFDTVVIDNTEVGRASLHNLSFIQELDLNIGSRILVSKRNLIIPHIEDNLDRDLGLLESPKVCPACGGQTEIRNTGTADFLFCVNNNCSAKLLDKFVHFVKRACMNIDGLSSASLELFLRKGFLKTFDSIYHLDQFRSQIVNLEGWGLKSYKKLIEAIEKSRKVKCSNLIYALGIPNVGSSSSKIIARYFNDDFVAFLSSCKNGFNFAELDDFGDITNQAIHDWYNDVNESDLWIDLLLEVEVIKEEKKELTQINNNPFKGKKIYATGTFAHYKKEAIKAELEGLGAEFANSYAKSLDYLIVGSVKGSSKEDKAKKDNVPILTEGEFLKMIGKEA